MTALHIIRGLPGSGKTTLAAGLVGDACVRVSRDDMRAMLTVSPAKQVLDFALEDAITAALQAAARRALRAGFDVVVDETNLRRRNVKAWVTLASELGAEVIDHTTFDVTVDEAIARDARREHSVGEAAIRDMHERFLRGRTPALPEPAQAPEAELYRPLPGTPEAYIVDIDGTLALHGERDIYDESKVHLDALNRDVADVIWAIAEHDADVRFIIMSGRKDTSREATLAWLAEQGLPKFDMLLMRAADDRRRDSIVKQELFDEHVRDRYTVRGVFDDRKQVVDMWRRLGLTCFQVADGDF